MRQRVIIRQSASPRLRLGRRPVPVSDGGSETRSRTRPAELFRALAVLCEPPEPEHTRLAALLELPGSPDRSEHTGLFLLELHPYASVYLGAEGMLGGEARDRVAGFWRALGRVPPAEPDHLAALLGLYASLVEAADGAGEPDAGARETLLARARAALLWEHLLSWLGPWTAKAEEIAPPVYRNWAVLLRAALLREAAAVGPPEKLPLHLREAPPLPDPREAGGEAFLAGLLAPARSGILLVRSDLERAGRELGLGVRKGERAYALRGLVGQDGRAVLAWVAAEAAAWGARHWKLGEREPVCRPVSAWWAKRAERTAALAGELARA